MKKFILYILGSSLSFLNAAYSWDRSSAGISPSPEEEPRAIVQVFAARAAQWRGYFSVHCWISVKEKNSSSYRVYDVNGWRKYSGRKVVAIIDDLPDRKWYGAQPELLYEVRGAHAEKLIPLIDANAKAYPYQNEYRAYPGPNSNTFISYIIRRTPEFYIDLPPNAIGKDWIEQGSLFGVSESGTGIQFSLFGLLGFTVGLGEGVEINLLGMSFGLDFLSPALKFPFIGRIGLAPAPVFDLSEKTPRQKF
jgi:hypothetical protein